MMKSGTEKVRELLLKCLGPYFIAEPERMVYQYDATWNCERQSDTWYNCAEGTEQDIDKRMEPYDGVLMGSEQYIAHREGEEASAREAKGSGWCRSCKAKKWLEDNPEASA